MKLGKPQVKEMWRKLTKYLVYKSLFLDRSKGTN